MMTFESAKIKHPAPFSAIHLEPNLQKFFTSHEIIHNNKFDNILDKYILSLSG